MTSRYENVDIEERKEIADDHMKLIRQEFDAAYRLNNWLEMSEWLDKAKRFYPDHPETEQMIKDFKIK